MTNDLLTSFGARWQIAPASAGLSALAFFLHGFVENHSPMQEKELKQCLHPWRSPATSTTMHHHLQYKFF